VTEPITSPTYTLVHSYDVPKSSVHGKVTLHHADLYRLDHTTEVADLALEELAEFDGIVLIEWGDVVESILGEHLVVHLDVDHDANDDGSDEDVGSRDTTRLIEIAGVGSTWAARWARIMSANEAFRC
jgi:tRNA threonylcarbamoyladenosine biosynthesis protein TsaE